MCGALMDNLKKNWQRCKFYTFPISFKKEILLRNANTFWISGGFLEGIL
jgi:hypothetical protein